MDRFKLIIIIFACIILASCDDKDDTGPDDNYEVPPLPVEDVVETNVHKVVALI